MMKQEISKEFINAMNGVLNGEKWCRSGWQGRTSWKFGSMPHIYCVGSSAIRYEYTDGRKPHKETYQKLFIPLQEDMTAKDWVKVE